MKITTFNPLIVTKDAAPVIKLFEALGCDMHHVKEEIGEDNAMDIRMKDAEGHCLDITQGTGEWTMIRVNVDDLEEAVALLEEHGFHKARHEVANKTIETNSSKINIMVSPTGVILSVSQHITD